MLKTISVQLQHTLPSNALYHLQLFQTTIFLLCFSAVCTGGDKADSCPYQCPILLVLFLLSQVYILIQEDSVKHWLDMREQHYGCRLCEQLGHWSDTRILHRTQP